MTTDAINFGGVVLLLNYLKIKRPHSDLMFFPAIDESTLKQLTNQIDFSVVARIVLLNDFKPEMNFIEWRNYSMGIKRTGCKCKDDSKPKRRYCRKKQYKGTKLISDMYFKSIGVKMRVMDFAKLHFHCRLNTKHVMQEQKH